MFFDLFDMHLLCVPYPLFTLDAKRYTCQDVSGSCIFVLRFAKKGGQGLVSQDLSHITGVAELILAAVVIPNCLALITRVHLRRAQLTLPHQCFLMLEDFVWKVGLDPSTLRGFE